MAEETLVATIRADLTAFQASMRQMVGEVHAPANNRRRP